ncbi:AMP-binding protein [Streptomyces sp. NPDC046831]|uniref:AMP-binding protein n=1 Tax=Streptomyces sp. NPDC046831 TaxID=3154805 RepID=UPI0033F463B9
MSQDAEIAGHCRNLFSDCTDRLGVLAARWNTTRTQVALTVVLAALSRQTADGATHVRAGEGASVRLAFPPGLPLGEAAGRIGRQLAGATRITATTPNPESDFPEQIELEIGPGEDGGLALRGTCAQRQMDRLVHALRHEYRPESTVREVPVACPADEEDLLTWERNPAPAPATTLDRAFARIARACPGRTAVQFPVGPGEAPAARRLTYGQAEAEAMRLASVLVKAGVQLGEPVVVVCENVARTVVDQLAVFKAGAVCVPVGRVTPEQARGIAALSGARWALCDAASRSVWERHCRVLGVPRVVPGRDEPPVEGSLPRSDFSEAAFLLVEGGTRRPLRAQLSAHTAWTSAIAARIQRVGHVSAEVVTGGDPAGPVALSAMWWAFACGARLRPLGSEDPLALPWVPRRASRGPDPDALFSPEWYRRLLDTLDPAGRLETFRSVVVCGAPCSADLVKQHFARSSDTRLLAEFAGDGGPLPWTARELAPADAECRLLPGAGRPSANVHVRVLDESGRSLPPGLMGEVCAEGSALPHELLLRDGTVVRSLSDHTLRSGRLGQLRMDGSLELADGLPLG